MNQAYLLTFLDSNYMVKLILQVNPKAGCEAPVFEKINEIYDKPFMAQLEQLSDFFIVLDFLPENVEKVLALEDMEGVLDVDLTPANIVVSSLEKAAAGEDYFVIFVDTEQGKTVETMNAILACDKFKIRNAGYFCDDRADLVLEVVSSLGANDLNHTIRDIAGVEDTIIYTLPHKYE